MAVESNLSSADAEKALINYVLDCKREAEEAKRDRMEFNKDNYAMYQMKHDFSHKTEGQSQEILPKTRMAVEQIKSFFQQAIADIGEWFRIEPRDPDMPEEALLIKPHEAQKLLTYMQTRSRYFSHVGNSIQSGLLGALIVTKTTGHSISKPKFISMAEGKGTNYRKNVVKVDDKTWELKNCIVRQEDYYPDPTGKGLYEIEYIEMDLYEVVRLSKGEAAIYDRDAVELLSKSMTPDGLRDHDMDRETGQNLSSSNQGHRPKVRLLEFWGNVVNSEGELEHENVVITIANDKYIIRKPTPNPLWHQKSPYTVSPLLEVANSVWHIALMDAPTKLNRTIIELHNLILDAAFKRVHAISQIRVHDLVDPTQVANGIPSGTKLLVKSSLPYGAKIMESVEDSDIPQDALNVLNIHQQEFNASALTNDLRQGVMSFRAVKATEVVEASQTITSIFQGIAKNFEARQILAELELQWMTTAQNWHLIAKDIFISLFGIERGTEMSQLPPQDVFVATVNGYKFQVFGVSQTLSKAQDFRKFTTLLQTIGSSDVLVEEFLKKYDFGKLLGEIMSSLDIDRHKISISESAGGQSPLMQGGPIPGANGDMSGVPGAQNQSEDLFASVFAPKMPQTQFS